MQNHLKRFILSLLLFFLSGILFYSTLLVLPLSCNGKNYILDVPEHSTADFVSRILEEDICVNSTFFKLGIYITFNQKNIRPGLYTLKDIDTLGDLIRNITSVSRDRKKITIFEGLNIYEIANYLSYKLNINKDKFIMLCLNEEYINSLDIPYTLKSLEGFLFPDTYMLLDTSNEKDIIEIMIQRFIDVYENHIKLLSFNNNLDISEIMTLASIIQGEAMLIEEMPTISSVYHNRLKRKMRLEADPTILYYMTKNDLMLFKDQPGSSISAKIFNKYKNIENPYNTYSIQGLPAGPINNPGLEAIKAALYPGNTEKNYLYFVANGTGGHTFSKTLRQHNQAINKIKYGY